MKTGRQNVTKQFKKRAPALAVDVGIDGLGENLAERLYESRSDWVHGSHVQLFAGPSAGVEIHGEDEREGEQSSEEQRAFAEVALLQDVLRGAVRRAIEDFNFRQVFEDEDHIKERWPI